MKWNVAQNGMSLKTECHLKWNIPHKGIKLDRHLEICFTVLIHTRTLQTRIKITKLNICEVSILWRSSENCAIIIDHMEDDQKRYFNLIAKQNASVVCIL